MTDREDVYWLTDSNSKVKVVDPSRKLGCHWSLLVNGGKLANGRVSMRGLWHTTKCILDMQMIKNIIKMKTFLEVY